MRKFLQLVWLVLLPMGVLAFSLVLVANMAFCPTVTVHDAAYQASRENAHFWFTRLAIPAILATAMSFGVALASMLRSRKKVWASLIAVWFLAFTVTSAVLIREGAQFPRDPFDFDMQPGDSRVPLTGEAQPGTIEVLPADVPGTFEITSDGRLIEHPIRKAEAQHPLSQPCQAQKAPGSRKNGPEG